MAWSEYKQTKWTAKRVSVDVVKVPSDEGKPARTGSLLPTWTLPDPSSFAFGVSCPYDTLTIDVHRPSRHNNGLLEVGRYGRFWLNDCRGALNAQEGSPDLIKISHDYVNPAGTQIDHMAFDSGANSSGLILDTGIKALPYRVLDKKPSPYGLVYPPADHPLNELMWLGDVYPFFYQDARRTYFAMPELVQEAAAALSQPNKVGPAGKPASLVVIDVRGLPDGGDPEIFQIDSSIVALSTQLPATGGVMPAGRTNVAVASMVKP